MLYAIAVLQPNDGEGTSTAMTPAPTINHTISYITSLQLTALLLCGFVRWPGYLSSLKPLAGLNPPFPPFWQASPELNRHSITARLLKHFSLSPTLWIVIFPFPPRPRQLNMFYMLVCLVPKSSAAQGPTPSARLPIALPFGTSTT
ncbi:hypothetical protein HPB50_015492 [Hyalomma asiaticum]|uniref:Uncharacterized protein n=1 Tax=Hyalomma asiaticum TaxID=266040 RepID=A0ACB7S3T9_HYAAI|nr:hypothetical protein HPB50_015492 [Hyalomma asiaticum]